MNATPRLGSSTHSKAVLTAVVVTVLWSSSYVLIEWTLADIPALTFAGLRYFLAFLVLLPVAVRRGAGAELREANARTWLVLVVLGVLLYAVTQGAQFFALTRIRAATVSLLLNFTPAVVAIVAVPALGERPTTGELLWMVVLLGGVFVFFWPLAIPASKLLGVVVMVVGLAGNALAAVLGRHVNRMRSLSPIAVTTVSMGVGGTGLLGVGVLAQGLPPLSLTNWLVVAWLAVVNTAVAFTLWNHSLRTLSAVESSVVNNTMLVQVAVLGWVFLGQSLSGVELVGLAFVGVGALAVQLAGR